MSRDPVYLQLATTSHSLLGGLGAAVSLCALRVRHSSGSPSWPKQRRTALVKELTITRPDRYLSRGPMVSNEGKIVKEEMSHHVQIIRMCPTLTHIGVCYFHVHQAKQRGLLDALEGRKSLRALSVIVESIPILLNQNGLCDFPQILRMICRSWPALRILSLTGFAIYSYDIDSPDAPSSSNHARVSHFGI